MRTTNKRQGNQTVIVIGAGAAGLLAARQLSEEGMKVVVVESASHAGGRMHTLRENGFSIPAEAGAEFVHGAVPITLGLLQEAGIEFTTVPGKMRTVRSGKWLKHDAMDAFWEELMQRMNEVHRDMTIDAFINHYFSDSKYAPLRDGLIRFAEGFDLADTSKASILSIKEEWSNTFDEEQYRITGGYSLLCDYLVNCCKQNNVNFYFSSEVNEISWKADKVNIHTSDKIIEGNKVLITVSAGIIRSGKIRFTPGLNSILEAYKGIGYGSVMKFLMEFREPFWINNLGDASFVLSDELIPTWWTQAPAESGLLTGWLGGPSAMARSSMPKMELLNLALQSLSGIFHLPAGNLQEMLVKSKILNWTTNPISLGGYSYSLPNSGEAKKMISSPIERTLFFAGEALYNGDAPGTVEAAFVTGQEAAVKILGS